jgi:glycosyltransferase involved in cell wall biosynthesis|tara:strand:- start:294 stop:1061 length:768 start_codon:yes stop_codon:yes gene_type:complete
MTFSIITTVLNNEKFILSCLNSLNNQKFNKKKIEHLIVDGGSTDNTIQIIKNFKKKNKYIKLFVKKKSSIYQAINFGIKKAKNDYIALLHSDDFYSNRNALNLVDSFFTKNKNIDAVYSNVVFVDRNNKKIVKRIFNSRQLSYTDFLKGVHPPHTSLFLKKKIYRKYTNYKTSYKIAADFEFMLRIFGILRVRSKYLNKTILNMRTGGVSTKSVQNIIASNIEVFKSLRFHNINFKFYYIILKILRKIRQIKLLN